MNKTVVKFAQIVPAAISLGICIYLAGQINGFDQGYTSAVFREYPHISEIQFSSSGPNFFEIIPTWYFVICVGFLLSIIGNLQKELTVSTGICLLSTGIIVLPFWQMIAYKNEVLAFGSKLPYDYWLNQSLYFDWFCLSVAGTLIITQIILIITRRFFNEQIEIN